MGSSYSNLNYRSQRQRNLHRGYESGNTLNTATSTAANTATRFGIGALAGLRKAANIFSTGFQKTSDKVLQARRNRKREEDFTTVVENATYTDSGSLVNSGFQHDELIEILDVPKTGLAYATDTTAKIAKEWAGVLCEKLEV